MKTEPGHRRSEGPSITRVLSAEHAFLDALLEGAIEASRAGRHPEARAQALRFVSALRSHLAAESAVLVPAVEGAAALTEPLRQEIERLRDGLEAIERQLDAGDAGLTSELGRLRHLLLPHERREEATFFPACDGALDAAQRIAAIRELGRRLW
jgi:hypothetical protein